MRTVQGGKSVKAGRASRGPACFSTWARQPSPREGGNLPSGAPLLSLRPAGAAPPQGCPQPIRWCGNSGFRLVPSYHNGAQGLGLQGKRTAPGGRFQKTVGFRFAFSQEGEIQLEDPAGNYRLCDFTAGAFLDRAVLTVYWDPHRKTGMKAGPVHVDGACSCFVLMALTGQPSRASWAASSWPSGCRCRGPARRRPHVEYLRAGAGAQAAADAVLIYCCVHIGHSYYSRIFPSRPSVTTCRE